MASISRSSPLASTPLATTATTTMMGTPSTFDSGQQQQQQQQQQSQEASPQGPSVARVISNNDTSTSSSNHNNSNVLRAPYFDGTELPEELASHFEHWASPTEVLQLRALCSDLVSKHKSEAESLRRELEDVKKSRDALQREVQETRKLRQLYVKAEGEYEKACRERERWSEERELFRLQLQRLSIENQRLQHILRKGFPPNVHMLRGGMASAPLSSGSGSGGTIPTSATAPTTTGSVIPTPSTSSGLTVPIAGGSRGNHPPQQQRQQSSDFDSGSAGNSSSMGDDYCGYTNASDGAVAGALREQLRLIEELHRHSTEYAELDARFRYSQTLWDITTARADQRSMLLVADNEKLKGQVRHWRGVAEENAGRLDAVSAQLRDRCGELEEARRELQTARGERQVAAEAELRGTQDSIASLKATHAEELARVQQQLHSALDDAARTREKLQGTLDAAQRWAGVQREELLAEVEAAEQKCGDALRAQRETAAALAEATAAHEQGRAEMEREFHLLQSAHEACLKERAEQSKELKEARDERAALTVRLHNAKEELRAVGERLDAALEKLQQAEETEEALIVARARAAEAEAEVQAQQSYCTEQARVHQAALMEMQKQRDAEVKRLGRTVERLQRRYASSKIRLAAAVKGIGRADAIALPQPPLPDRDQPQREEGGAGCLAQEPVGPDVVFLLKQSTAAAATLARTIHRGVSAA